MNAKTNADIKRVLTEYKGQLGDRDYNELYASVRSDAIAQVANKYAELAMAGRVSDAEIKRQFEEMGIAYDDVLEKELRSYMSSLTLDGWRSGRKVEASNRTDLTDSDYIVGQPMRIVSDGYTVDDVPTPFDFKEGKGNNK